MASANKTGSNRPLSPHLQIWRWGPAMLVSILHRVTGSGLSLVGLAVLLWWLGALVSGPEAYASFAGWVWADVSSLEWSGAAIVPSLVRVLFKVVMVGLTWAFWQHTATGIRHFVLDIGAGYELETNARWSIITIVASVLLTAATWACILSR